MSIALWLASVVGFAAWMVVVENVLPVAWRLARGETLEQCIADLVRT